MGGDLVQRSPHLLLKKESRERAPAAETSLDGDPGPSSSRSVQNHGTATSEEDLAPEELEELEMQRILLAEANARKQQQETTPVATHAVLNANSNGTGTIDWGAWSICFCG